MHASIGPRSLKLLWSLSYNTFTSTSPYSRYFEGNAQFEYHSNVADFYRQIYFETVDTS